MDDVSEDELLGAGREGRVLECGDGGTLRRVDAALLRCCCRELKDQFGSRGVRVRNAAVVGCLDLAGLEIAFPLRFEGCDFDSALVVEGAQLYELGLTGCPRLPGLLANGVRVRRDLELSRTRVNGAHRTSASTSQQAAIWLCESDIGGRLLCVDTVIEPGNGRSIQADRMHIGGTIRLLHQFIARGEVRLIGARIDGSLDLTGARIESASSTGLALDLGEAVIEGSVFLVPDASGRRPVIRGRIDMGGARVTGQVLVRGATLEARSAMPAGSAYSRSRVGGTAVSAPRLTVGAEVTLEDHCQVTGGIDLSMSELSSLSIGPGCSLHAPGRTALDLTNAEFRSTVTVGDKVPVEGTIRLSGARVRGNICLRGAVLSAPEGKSLLAAQGVRVDGEVELQGLAAEGGDLGFRAATVGSVMDASGAHLRNALGYTLNLHQANVRGSVRLVDGFESTGVVVLNRATVEGRLLCTQGSFDCPAPTGRNPRGHAVEAISATIRGGVDLGWTRPPSPSVDFTNASTTFLADDPATWPSSFLISGFTYDRFEQPQGGGPGRTWDHAARCAWLKRQAAYDASPYEQAARVFRQHGYADGAKAILIAQHRHARRTIEGRWALPRRVLGTAYDLTVGYGYRPGRVLWLLGLLLILVTISLQVHGPQAAMRATSAGTVYTTQGPLQPRNATRATSASTPGATSHGPSADACGDGQIRCFNSFLYATDTVIPLISLGQRSTWYPDTHAPYGTLMQWWLNAAAVLGWLLSSIFVLSLASLARSL
jgi:hypothetical protein